MKKNILNLFLRLLAIGGFFAIVLLGIEIKHKYFNPYTELYEEYPIFLLDDSINSMVRLVYTPEKLKIGPEIRQVEFQNGEKRTIFAQKTEDGVSVGGILKEGCIVVKESGRDSIEIKKINGRDTAIYKFWMIIPE